MSEGAQSRTKENEEKKMFLIKRGREEGKG